MSEITCTAIDCAHIDDYGCCRLREISLSEHYIYTVYEGLQHFWKCEMYEKSEQTKRLERMFIECLRKDGVKIV